jgi:predicted  nucleic acid-binding Zn-ribbon protein
LQEHQKRVEDNITKLQAEYDGYEASIKSFASRLKEIIDEGRPITIRLSRLSERKSRNEYNRFMTEILDSATPLITRIAELRQKQGSLKGDIQKLRSQPVAEMSRVPLATITPNDIAHTSLADS